MTIKSHSSHLKMASRAGLVVSKPCSDKLCGSSEMPQRPQVKGLSVCWGVRRQGWAPFQPEQLPSFIFILELAHEALWSGPCIPLSSSELPCLPGFTTAICSFLRHKGFLASGISLVICLVWTTISLPLCLFPMHPSDLNSKVTSLGMPSPTSLKAMLGPLAAYIFFIALLQL